MSTTNTNQDYFARLVRNIVMQVERGCLSQSAPEAPLWGETEWQALLIKTQAKREAMRRRVGRREIRKLRRKLGLVK